MVVSVSTQVISTSSAMSWCCTWLAWCADPKKINVCGTNGWVQRRRNLCWNVLFISPHMVTIANLLKQSFMLIKLWAKEKKLAAHTRSRNILRCIWEFDIKTLRQKNFDKYCNNIKTYQIHVAIKKNPI